MTAGKLNILVSGMVAGVPNQGGASWAVLQYVLGFQRLGHDVCFVEPVAETSLKPPGKRLADSTTASYFRRVCFEFGLEQNAAVWLTGSKQSVGLEYPEWRELARRADVLIDISGMLGGEELIHGIPIRVYLDLDPGFNQLWRTVQGIDMHFAGHTHYATVGLAIGHPDCPVPTCGLTWITTLPPVVLERWPAADFVTYDALTTVANWRGYGSIEHQGVVYGQKAHSLRQFMDLPTRTNEEFLLALDIHPDEKRDRAALDANGWKLADPAKVANSPENYRRFIQGSKAEFGIAKSGYVASRGGWFSDRSACYLASGRPVIAQETGFSKFLPTGEGLFSFKTREDVLAALAELNRDYPRHAHAARVLAEEHLDSDKVLGRLLRQVGAS